MTDHQIGKIGGKDKPSISWGNDDEGAYIEVNWPAPPPPPPKPPPTWNAPPPPYRLHPKKKPKIVGADPKIGWAVKGWKGEDTTEVDFKVLDSCEIEITVYLVINGKRYPISTTVEAPKTGALEKQKAKFKKDVESMTWTPKKQIAFPAGITPELKSISAKIPAKLKLQKTRSRGRRSSSKG